MSPPEKDTASDVGSPAGSSNLKKIRVTQSNTNGSGGKQNIAKSTMLGGSPKRVLTMADLNEEYALLIQETSAYISRRDFQPITDTDLRRRLEDAVVQTGSKDGVPSYTPAYKFWTGHAERHIFRHTAFTNKPIPSDTINLYRGLGVKPKQGNCEKILAHIRDVLCSGNEKDADAFIKLVAWQIQNIGEPSRIITVLRSKQQQVGKGIFLEMLAGIYGPSGFIAAQIEQVLGRFNTAIRGRAFVFLDEVLFAGDRKAADSIKSLSTQSQIGIEAKGLPIVQCPIALNFWLASNHENAAHIEEHDARYWVLNADPKYYGDSEYFSKLLAEIHNGGCEAFAHYILNLDVSGFKPSRDVPKDNAAKREMIRLSVNPFDASKWLEDCAHTGRIIGMRRIPDAEDMESAIRSAKQEYLTPEWAEWNEGDRHEFSALCAAYSEWQKTVKSPIAAKPTALGNLGEILKLAGVDRKQRRTPKPLWFCFLPSTSQVLEAYYAGKLVTTPSRPSHPPSQGGFDD